MEQEKLGYKMEVEKILNINDRISIKEEITINATAFMDDTTIIGRNKESIEKMVTICHEFFQINEIKANIGKYELIKINSQEENLSIEGKIVEKMNNNEGHRYLGIWFKHNNKRKIFKKKIKSIVDQACKIFTWKKLTEKQIRSVWNMVIISHIEYQIQAIVLSEGKCENLMYKFNMLMKRCAGLTISTPNMILYDKELFGLKLIYDLQRECLVKNLIYQANGNSKLKKIFKIKLIQEQQRIWTARCIGDLDSKIIRGNNCWIRDALLLLKSEGISICNHEIKDGNELHNILGGKIEIVDLLPLDEILRSAESRKKKGVLFMKQLLESNNQFLMK